MWLYLPQLVLLRLQLYCNCLTSVLTELYNSSTPTQSPTRSLESHVGSSSSGNNCHAVHKFTLFRCISLWVYHGIFYLVPFRQPISRRRDFLSLLPLECVTSFRCISLNGIFGGSKVKIQHGVHRSTSVMSSSLLLQQCPTCLVRLTWIVFVMGGRWLYCWVLPPELVQYCSHSCVIILLVSK